MEGQVPLDGGSGATCLIGGDAADEAEECRGHQGETHGDGVECEEVAGGGVEADLRAVEGEEAGGGIRARGGVIRGVEADLCAVEGEEP